MALNNSMMLVGVSVLLVDSNVSDLLCTTKLLQSNFYQVSAARDISLASLELSRNDANFDVVMFDTNLSDPEGCSFVQNAIKMGVVVILLCPKADSNQLKSISAIEGGAFLMMHKPLPREEIQYLWQHVLREKVRKNKRNTASGEPSIHRGILNISSANNPTQEMDLNRDASNNRVTSQNEGVEFINFGPSQGNVGSQHKKPKLCMEWTAELHQKFMDAIRQLGDGRCFPKDILEIMNVPGLTRMQVASHLQKCRYGVQHPRLKKVANRSPAQPPKARRYGQSPCLMIEGSQNNQNDGNNSNIEPLLPTNGALNIGQQAPLGPSIAINQIVSSDDLFGNIMNSPPPQGLQADASLDIPIADDFVLQPFDYGYNVVADEVQTYPDAGAGAGAKEPEEKEPGDSMSPWM